MDYWTDDPDRAAGRSHGRCPEVRTDSQLFWSDAGQKTWAEQGYRPVNKSLVDESVYPTPEGRVHDRRVRWLGQGRRRVLRGRQDRLTAEIEKELGSFTEG